MSMFRIAVICLALVLQAQPVLSQKQTGTNPKIHIAFLWHMHQPIYWPYETVVQTDQNGRYSYSVTDIHNQRWGPYTSWPGNAIQMGITAGLPHAGAQVSFSGSLIENLNVLEQAGNNNFQNWKVHWNTIRQQNTVLGNPRMDMVGFGYHHPLMGLVEYDDVRRQIQAHKQIMAANFAGPYSKGIFPPENAFSPRMIPALVDEGLEWVMVDNIHFDRATQGYPFSTSGNLYEANKADVRNPNPGDWVQLNGLWAPTQNSARWGRQPHRVEYVDPSTGAAKRIIAVPADRYLGNEDGRGGFGALNYDYVMSQLEPHNTDPDHPILIVLHHDGDNYGGGSESYYNSNFQNFINWVQANPSRFVFTTVQDYLEMYPPAMNDVIHIEDGSWSGADNGDPEFKKWNADPVGGYSPDRNSWGVITAAKNFVATAQQINPGATGTLNAWKYFLNGEASDYWYWDGSQNGIWDSHPARASLLAIPHAQSVIATGTDLTPPTIYTPQREPYNPGATEWGINQPGDYTVWSYVFDLSGLQAVTLKYRTDLDGTNSSTTNHNETYAGGTDVSVWTDITMSGIAIPSHTNPQPLFKAKEYSAVVTGLNNVLVDYYIEAVDSNGNTARSPIMHVWVGENTSSGGGVLWSPTTPTRNDSITIVATGATQGAKLHWGVNNTGSSWQTPHVEYWPAGTVLFNGTGPAVETPFDGPVSDTLRITIGPFNHPSQGVERVAFVIHYNDNTWNNNDGQDFHITISGNPPPQQGYVMDGSVDTSATIVSTNNGLTLSLGWNGVQLYVATQSAQSVGSDMFAVVADSQRALRNAMWAKSGTVAGWSAFLGNESVNNWNGWFNASENQITGSAVNAAAGILEGALNVQSTLGHIPETVYVAVGKYQTQDGGLLTGQVPAGNVNGNIESGEFFAFPLGAPPAPPLAPQLEVPADGAVSQPVSVTLRWFSSGTATTYGVQLSADSTFAGGFVVNIASQSDTFQSVTGLTPNTTYYWRARARNIGGSSPWSQVRKFSTMVLPPAQVILLLPVNGAGIEADSVLLVWQNAGLTVTRYRLEYATDSLFFSAIIDSNITDTTMALPSLTAHQKYWWRVRAWNASGWGPFSVVRSFTVVAGFVSVRVPFVTGWNMLSNPVITMFDSVYQLYPGSILPEAFLFNPVSGYVQSSRMAVGPGYWVKMGTSDTASVGGNSLEADTIALSAGWNMIGSISLPVAVSSVTTIPANIIDSEFFEYSGAYVPASSINPGGAYWVKVNAGGMMVLKYPAVPVHLLHDTSKDP